MTTTVRLAAGTEISKTEVVTKTSLSLLISGKYFQLENHQDIVERNFESDRVDSAHCIHND